MFIFGGPEYDIIIVGGRTSRTDRFDICPEKRKSRFGTGEGRLWRAGCQFPKS